MREYGWDYYTYLAQPTWILEMAIEKMTVEAKLAAKAAEK